MDQQNTDQQERLLTYLSADEPRDDAQIEAEDRAIADSLDNEMAPLLRQIQQRAAPSTFESEEACLELVSKLESLVDLPVTRNGPLRYLREYELQYELGSGGMGTVYRANHAKLGKAFAVKVLSSRSSASERAVARFLREMRAAGKIEHANVVAATDAGESDGVHYLAMEFVDGVNLSQLVDIVGPLPVPDACKIAQQAALGLQAIHDHGLVHRDVKPSNLMLGTEGQVKVMDLGLALLNDSLSTSESVDRNRIVGTTQYMAPEQFVDSYGVDARADLYGLGGTLHFLLTASLPRERCAGQVSNSTVDGHSANTRPDELNRIIDRLLARDPADRFATAAEVAEALEPFCSGADLKRIAARRHQTPLQAGDTKATLSNTPKDLSTNSAIKATSSRRYWLYLAVSVLAAALVLGGIWSVTVNRDGELVLTIRQPGSKILINGQPHDAGAHPPGDTLILQLPPGGHRIDVSLAGHQTWSRTVHIGRREPVHLTVQLTPVSDDAQSQDAAVPSDQDLRERRLAEWVLQRRGTAKLYSGGQIQKLSDLPAGQIRIQGILLSRKELRDEDIFRYLGLSNLQSLEFSGNQLTDQSLELISHIETLRWLYLSHNYGISDGAASDLARLKNLESLDLRVTQISDKTVKHIADLWKLRELLIGYTKVTDDCLADIERLSGLVRLDLSHTRVTGRELRRLERLENLRELNLEATAVTDAAVPALKQLVQLTSLSLSDTELSAAAIADLRASLPDCEIEH